MSFKRKKIVMLPTQDKTALIYFYHNVLRCSIDKTLNENFVQDGTFKFQHLYILCESKREIGDWYIGEGFCGEAPFKWSKSQESRYADAYHYKIIASTNPELNLPMPSLSFVEKFVEDYNYKKPITHVMIEYIRKFEESNRTKPYVSAMDMDSDVPSYIDTVKVNKKDNTVTIRKIKDNWTREELDDILLKVMDLGMTARQNQLSGHENKSGKDVLENWKLNNLF